MPASRSATSADPTSPSSLTTWSPKARTRRPSTATASVSKVFNHAVDWQLINHAPKIKFMKEPEGRIRYFSDDEQAELIAYFRDEGLEWMADVVIVSLKTGARKGEVVALIDGEVAISDCGQWLMLTPEVTKTNKARNLPLNDVSRAAAWRLAGTGVYSKRKFERAWAKAQRDVFRATRARSITSAGTRQRRRWSMTWPCRP